MMKLYKIMLAALFIFSCFVPLSVFAEEQSSTFEITNGDTFLFNGTMTDQEFRSIILGSPYDLSNTFSFKHFTSGNIYFIYSADSFSSDGLFINFSAYVFLPSGEWVIDSHGNNINSSSSNSKIYFNSLPRIPGSQIITNWNGRTYNQFVNLFDVESNDSSWSADFNEILSNPYIAELVGVAKDNNIDSWYIDFTIKRTPNGTSGYTIKTLGYQYSFTLYDSNSNYLESIIFNQLAGEECRDSVCRPLTSYTVSVENVTILKSSWLAVPDSGPIEIVNPSGNDLLEYGNSSTQQSTSGIDSATSSLDSSASQYEQFESQFNSNLTSSLANIDVNSINLVNSNDFVKTAAWVKVQFDDILDNSGIYKTAISFVLIIGLALLLLGRRL